MSIPQRYAERMSPQVAVRLSAPLLVDIDDLVASGRFESRAEAIRAGIEQLVDHERRRRTGEAIVEGYRRAPQAADRETELGEYPMPPETQGG